MVKSMETVSPLLGFSDVAGLECDECGLENPGDEDPTQSSGRAESRSPSVLCILHVFWRERKGWTWLSEMRSKGMSRQAGNGGISNLAKFLWRNWSPCSELDPPLNYDDMIEVLLCREMIRARSVFFCMPLELKAWYTCWCR